MNSCRGLLIVSLAMLVVLCATSAFASVPLVTSYQGRLLDASDQPLTGSYTMIFQIYDVPVGGAPLWTEDHVGVMVTDGLFSVALGATVPLSAELLTGSGGGGGGGSSRYLQIQIAGQPAISPRTQLAAAPFAVAAGSVSGDIVTIPGGAILSNALGTKGLALRTTADSASITIDESGAHRVKISSSDGSGGGAGGGGVISITGDPDFDLLRLTATQDSAKIRISGQSIGDPDFDLLRIVGGTGTGTAGASVTITGDPDFDLLRLSADHDSAKIRLGGKITGDPDFDLLRLTGGSGASHLLMQSEPSGIDSRSHSLDADCDDASARLAIKTKGTSAKREIRHNTDSLIAESSVAADLDGDGLEDLAVSSSTDATSARLAIKTKGTGADANRTATISSGTNVGSASTTLDIDDDGDTVPESEISQLLTPTTSSMAIKTKGTGADKNRTIGSTCDDSSAVHLVEIDDDGDGISEGRGIVSVKSATGSGSMSNASSRMTYDSDDDGFDDNDASMVVTPTTSSVAIKTKGTGAEANKTASLTVTASPGGSVSSIGIADTDGDGTNDEEISQIITPTTSGVAIKTKGTGADKDRIASVSSTTGFLVAGTASVIDDDGDGVPESEISQMLTPMTSNVAIKTKGTGADPNRIVGATDDTSAAVLLATDDASITMKVRKGGVVTGSIIVTNGSAMRMVDFGSDGNGYFATGVGVGVDPTHAVDVAGGAYCDGTNWVNASDANSKENFSDVDGAELLKRLTQLAITKWNYKDNPGVDHIGPTAQDFQAVFGVGSNGKSISTIDPAGIALAAAKELSVRLSEKTEQIDKLESEVQQLRELVEKLLSEKK